jgi:hypothetical protein
MEINDVRVTPHTTLQLQNLEIWVRIRLTTMIKLNCQGSGQQHLGFKRRSVLGTRKAAEVLAVSGAVALLGN